MMIGKTRRKYCYSKWVEKAYYSVDWGYLSKVMAGMHFPAICMN